MYSVSNPPPPPKQAMKRYQATRQKVYTQSLEEKLRILNQEIWGRQLFILKTNEGQLTQKRYEIVAVTCNQPGVDYSIDIGDHTININWTSISSVAKQEAGQGESKALDNAYVYLPKIVKIIHDLPEEFNVANTLMRTGPPSRISLTQFNKFKARHPELF